MEPVSVPPPTGIPVLLQLGLLLLLTAVQARAQNLFENCTGTGQAIWCRHGPLQVAGDLRFHDIAPGVQHTCGVTTAGSAYCWGRNDGGQMGDGTTGSERRRPVRAGG
jgi:alpha-tubulin suppressor-like RCC1 family protein